MSRLTKFLTGKSIRFAQLKMMQRKIVDGRVEAFSKK